jgi:hypothetical protein
MIRAQATRPSFGRLLREPGAFGRPEGARGREQVPLYRLQLGVETLAFRRLGFGFDTREERSAVRELLDHVLEPGDTA